jgi:hypothetical protein
MTVAMLAPSRPGGGRRVGRLTPEHAEALMGMQAGWTARAGKLRPRWKLVGNAVAVCVAKWVVGRVIQRGWKQRSEPQFEPDRRDTPFTADAVVDTPRGTWPRCAWGVRQGRGFAWFASAASEAPVVTPLARLERFIKGDLRPVDAGWARRLVARMKGKGTDTAVVVEAARAFDVDVEGKGEVSLVGGGGGDGWWRGDGKKKSSNNQPPLFFPTTARLPRCPHEVNASRYPTVCPPPRPTTAAFAQRGARHTKARGGRRRHARRVQQASTPRACA